MSSLDLSLDELIRQREGGGGKPEGRGRGRGRGRGGRGRGRGRGPGRGRGREHVSREQVSMEVEREKRRDTAKQTARRDRRRAVSERRGLDVMEDDDDQVVDQDVDQEGGQGGEQQKGSIFSRLGPKKSSTVFLSNLPYDVLETELLELFSSVGKVVTTSIHYDASGRSLGKGKVEFAEDRDAEKAVQEYHETTIDGRTMKVSLARPAGGENNVRAGLFGTALPPRGGGGGGGRGRGNGASHQQRNTKY